MLRSPLTAPHGKKPAGLPGDWWYWDAPRRASRPAILPQRKKIRKTTYNVSGTAVDAARQHRKRLPSSAPRRAPIVTDGRTKKLQ
ncbi:hypothetical protein ACFJIW_14285 [Tahibacter sp. UC22_41]|uniref:hypothetical protein n=1 Tax=Tahibacter sp. UC22_41 TaxID=3350178 RepID=UPI0036D7DB0D